jgi:FAD/FMN-containing dehydrogenase
MTNGSVPQEAVDQLRAAISGETLTAVDAGYDAVRQVHNGMIDRRPAVIVRCQNTADIADAVKFAREHTWRSRSAAVATTWLGAL